MKKYLFFLFLIFVPTVYGQNTSLLLHAWKLVSSSADNISLIRQNIAFAPKVPAPEKPSIQDLERRAFDILNQKRIQMGLTPLVWSEELALAARLHSENMALYKFFSHVGLDGSLVSHRAGLFGVRKWRAIGENIAYNRGFDDPVLFVCDGWMKSQGHRENILNARWRESAIGIAVSEDGTYYFTQVFVER